MRALWQDIRYGARMLRKTPGFTAIALATLAIGIGANTIMFSISDLLLLRPANVKEPERLAYCAIQDTRWSRFHYSEYQTICESGLAFSDVIAQSGSDGTTLVHHGSARHASVMYASANYFSVLGVAPAWGRGFLPEEAERGSAPVAVLSHRCWQRLGGDPELLGTFVNINTIQCQIVGIAPEDFAGVALEGPDLWLSVGSYYTVNTDARRQPDREIWLELVGRLKPGVTLPVAQTQLQALSPPLKPDCFEASDGVRPAFDLRPPGRFFVAGDYAGDLRDKTIFSLALMGAAAIILLIACLNLANMLIVQGTSRQREVAVRMALGGGRWRIVRQLLVESLLLAILGGALGVLLACGGMKILNVWVATRGRGLQVDLNVRILAATLGVCLIATLLFGLKPALWLSKRDIAGEMKAATGRVLGSFQRTRTALAMAGQIALAVALVLSAALLTRSALLIARPDPNFRLDNKLVVTLDPQSTGYDEERNVQVCQAVMDHLASLPEVDALGTSHNVFFGGGGTLLIGEYHSEAKESKASDALVRNAAYIGTGRDYFQAMEIPLLRGRLFNEHDRLPDAEHVVIIDEPLARKLRPDGNALDCFIQLGLPEFPEMIPEPYRVVGIVPHVPGIENREVGAQMYSPIGRDALTRCLYLHVTNKGTMDAMQQRITEEIRRVDPRLAVFSVTTLAQKRYDYYSAWVARLGARIGLAAGAAALFLATLGIYAIKGYMVASRTSEIGIRMALGATHRNVMGMVLREGLLLTIVGLVAGLALGLAVAKVAARFLYGISPIDPVSIVITVTLLGIVALLAGYFPARRAAKVDPMEALRYE